jgi:hypothetical protein
LTEGINDKAETDEAVTGHAVRRKAVIDEAATRQAGSCKATTNKTATNKAEIGETSSKKPKAIKVTKVTLGLCPYDTLLVGKQDYVIESA